MKGTTNMVYSPLSIQTCLAMTRMGAEGSTATEMDQYLGFTGRTTESVADDFHTLLTKYEKSNILQIANKVYVSKDLELQDKYNEILSEKFFSSVENVDFSERSKAANIMNSWVESKTNNVIKNLISSDIIDGDTKLVLLRAIHFKGKWKSQFKAEYTEKRDFFLDEDKHVQLETMFKTGNADVAYRDDMKILRLPYEDSDVSMLSVLPNDRNGLSVVQDKLKGISLQSVTKDIVNMKVDVYLPKFKVEFEIQMNDVLKKVKCNCPRKKISLMIANIVFGIF